MIWRDRTGTAVTARCVDYRSSSHDRRGIKLIIDHEHVFRVLKMKQVLLDQERAT